MDKSTYLILKFVLDFKFLVSRLLVWKIAWLLYLIPKGTLKKQILIYHIKDMKIDTRGKRGQPTTSDQKSQVARQKLFGNPPLLLLVGLNGQLSEFTMIFYEQTPNPTIDSCTFAKLITHGAKGECLGFMWPLCVFWCNENNSLWKENLNLISYLIIIGNSYYKLFEIKMLWELWCNPSLFTSM